jgi:hypothetical protein
MSQEESVARLKVCPACHPLAIALAYQVHVEHHRIGQAYRIFSDLEMRLTASKKSERKGIGRRGSMNMGALVHRCLKAAPLRCEMPTRTV